MFALLDKQRMRIAELPNYVDKVGVYRDFNARFFHLRQPIWLRFWSASWSARMRYIAIDGWLRRAQPIELPFASPLPLPGERGSSY
jgi:hypothetical protein